MVNHLTLSAKFDEVPSERTRQLIEAEMRSFLQAIAPDAYIKVTTIDGSWWIVLSGVAASLGGWLINEIASWALNKGLDHLVAKSASDVPSPSSNPIVEIAGNEHLGRKRNQAEHMSDHMAAWISNMKGIAEKTGAKEITFAAWSDEIGVGRIAHLSMVENGITFNLIQTDSHEEFNSRTIPQRLKDS